jgi:hypothetical protein
VSAIEPILLATALCAFVKARAFRVFPAFGAFLIFRLGVDLTLDFVLQSAKLSILEKHLAYQIYFYTYWISYLAGAVMIFLVIQEIFSHLTKLIPGFGRLGLLAFRWVTLISVLVAVALSIRPGELKWDLLVSATSGVMRCMSVLELCLLAFIVVAMQTFQLSSRSRDFGVALGLAMIAAAELFGSAFAFGHTTMATVANYSGEIASILAAATWAAYFIFEPEPAGVQSAASPISLPLSRWTEVADALGHPPPQIALGASSHFFLQDVEKAVDKVLENNSDIS